MVSVGTSDHLLDDSLIFASRAAAADVDVDLFVLPEMPHGFPGVRLRDHPCVVGVAVGVDDGATGIKRAVRFILQRTAKSACKCNENPGAARPGAGARIGERAFAPIAPI